MTREEARQKAIALVDKMTDEERAGQLRYNAPAIERLGIPAYNWWNEGLHGVARAGTATVFPQAIGMAASFDETLLYDMGKCVGVEGRAKYNAYSKEEDRDIYKGLTFWSPNVNIFRDPRWGRGHETYGEDPYLTSRLGISFTKGLQGDGEHLLAAACAKHFAVHSGPEASRHEMDVCPSKKDMEETYLPAFEALVKEADVESVMGAYNRVNGKPCCGSDELIADKLRGEWNFKGHFVSDCWAIRDFHENHKVTNSPKESVAMALNAGCDLNCGTTYLCMMAALKDKLITKEQIKEAAVRLFTTRYLLGLFDGSEYDSIPYDVVECKEHVLQSEKAALESAVLLKNNGVLPLDCSKIKTIGVIGPNADSRRALIGNYHGTSSDYITILQGIREYVGEDVRVMYSEGCGLNNERAENLSAEPDRYSEARIVAGHSDAVVLVLGLDETLEGEEGDDGNAHASGDKETLDLPYSQIRLMEEVAKVGKPVILCNMTGSCVKLGYAKEHFDAIMQVWYPGAHGGRSIAKLIFGEVSPSGKLPITFYKSENQLPDFMDYSMEGRTYRYLQSEPEYPFGYGLTYGEVKVTAASAKIIYDGDDFANADRAVEVEVNLENCGKVAIGDVVQVYIHDEESGYASLNPCLCGFMRVDLAKGEKKTIAIPVSGRAFTVVDEDGIRQKRGSRFMLYVGTSAPDELSRKLSGQSVIKLNLTI